MRVRVESETKHKCQTLPDRAAGWMSIPSQAFGWPYTIYFHTHCIHAEIARTTGLTPWASSNAVGPMPDTCMMCGELMAPAESTTSPPGRNLAVCWSLPLPVAECLSRQGRPQSSIGAVAWCTFVSLAKAINGHSLNNMSLVRTCKESK